MCTHDESFHSMFGFREDGLLVYKEYCDDCGDYIKDIISMEYTCNPDLSYEYYESYKEKHIRDNTTK